MSLRYNHLLVPTSPNFTPTAQQVQHFLGEMNNREAIGGEIKVALRKPSNRTRQVRNPFNGEVRTLQLPDFQKLEDIDQVASALTGLDEYGIAISGMGWPVNPPLPVSITDPYHIGFWCLVWPDLRSMSDLHEESGDRRDPISFGERDGSSPTLGLFSNPHTLEVIEVPEAGCARFCVELELGNSLFPPIGVDLEILDPFVVATASNIFGIRFVQGCHWG